MAKVWSSICAILLLSALAIGQGTSVPVRTPLSPVVVLYVPVPALVQVSGDHFEVRWDYPGTGHGGFEITASSDGWATIHASLTVGPDQESALVPGLSTATTYDWRVRTLPPPGGGGCYSAPGAPICAMATAPFATPPQVAVAPSNLQVPPSGVGAASIQLTWTDNTGIEIAYEVRRLDPGEIDEPTEWDDISGYLAANTQTYTATNLLPGATYRFKVRAVSPVSVAGFSLYSNVVIVTTAAALPRPTNLQVTDYGGNSVLLAWQDNAVDETAYRVAILPPGGDPDNPAEWNSVDGDLPANTTSHLVAGLTASSNYQFKVRARSDALLPPSGPLYSNYSNIVLQRTGPRNPTGLVTTAVGVDYVTLAWVDHASTETAYRVSVLPPGGDPNNDAHWINDGGDLPVNTEAHTVTGLQSGAAYSFRVRAKDGTVTPAVYSAYTNVVTTTLPVPLATPTNMAIANVGPDWIQVTWQDNAVGESAYRVAMLPPGGDPNTPGDWVAVSGDLAPNTQTYTATGLLPNASYRFKTRCSNVNVTPVLYSNYSNIATGSTVCPLPAAPTGLNATAVSDTCVTLAWNDVANNELAYRVAMLPPGLDPNNPNDWIGVSGDLPAGTTTFTKTGLTTGATYRFKVRGSNACGEGNYSGSLTVVALEQGPPAPTGCLATRQGSTPSPDPILVEWSYGAAQIDGFRISRLGPGGDPVNDPPSAWINVGGDLGPGLRQYLDTTSLLHNNRYYYRVRAYRNTPCGRVYSDYSNVDDALP